MRIPFLFPVITALGLSAAAVPESHVSVLTGAEVIQILDETVDWYRTLGTQQQNSSQPSDLLILFANRQTADKVVALAFDIARANAELISSEADTARPAAGAPARQSLGQQEDQLDARRLSIQQEMDAVQRQVKAPGGAKQDLDAKLHELQGELAMVDARKNLLDTMTDFVNQSDPKAAGATALKARIEAIAATIPASSPTVATAPAAPVPTSAVAATGPGAASMLLGEGGKAAPQHTGIIDLASDVLRQWKKIGAIDTIDQHSARLAETFRKIGDPPLKQLQEYSARSDALAVQAENAAGAALQGLRGEFDTLAWLFKQTSAILLPLSEEDVLLQQYRRNLANWRETAERQYHGALAALGLRLGILGAILTAVFALGEVWRRGVLRYTHEPHRRYQLLLVRRIVVWTLVIGIIALGSVTEISTFATFAGLLTAGLAVALQSVLASVAGYFFLIGKYGIRVGDQIQIGTVVGEVLDLGLVRMHLREINQEGPLGPTGRVVAFSNLVVFQASGGLFKQLPNTNLSWHETSLPLPAVSDYVALKQRLLAAMGSALADFTEEFRRQAKEIERTSGPGSAAEISPLVRMRLADGGMRALVRYPIIVKSAAEIDERVAQAVLTVIAGTAGRTESAIGTLTSTSPVAP
jgi:small-conductance mechanosensitive channel